MKRKRNEKINFKEKKILQKMEKLFFNTKNGKIVIFNMKKAFSKKRNLFLKRKKNFAKKGKIVIYNIKNGKIVIYNIKRDSVKKGKEIIF